MQYRCNARNRALPSMVYSKGVLSSHEWESHTKWKNWLEIFLSMGMFALPLSLTETFTRTDGTKLLLWSATLNHTLSKNSKTEIKTFKFIDPAYSSWGTEQRKFSAQCQSWSKQVRFKQIKSIFSCHSSASVCVIGKPVRSWPRRKSAVLLESVR
jgi:hypothetical protein